MRRAKRRDGRVILREARDWRLEIRELENLRSVFTCLPVSLFTLYGFKYFAKKSVIAL